MRRMKKEFPEKWGKFLEKNRVRGKNPLVKKKKNAHLAIYRAIKSGELIKSKVCEVCGLGGKIQGHHEDYDDPLSVVWVCVRCHADIHKKKRGLD